MEPLILLRTSLSSPLGGMIALASEQGLCALEFVGPRRLDRLNARLRRWFPQHTIEDARSPVFDATDRWLARYFHGDEMDEHDVPLDLRGAKFERRVWDALLAVPCGTTLTYGEIASRLGRPSAARAVGLAVGSNPVSLIVPCHRIIGSSGSLTGYGGGLDRKRWLLEHESRRDRPEPARLF